MTLDDFANNMGNQSAKRTDWFVALGKRIAVAGALIGIVLFSYAVYLYAQAMK